MTTIISILIFTFIAGIILGITGFGASIIMIMALPSLFVLSQAA